MPVLFQLSNRLGSAKCAADLVPPSAVARTGEQAITIEGKDGDIYHFKDKLEPFFLYLVHILQLNKKQILSNLFSLNLIDFCLPL